MELIKKHTALAKIDEEKSRLSQPRASRVS